VIMTVYAVTGASGQLGHLIVDGLLTAGVPAADIVAVVRTPAKVADLAARGVQVREGDYNRADSLTTAFAGVDVLMFVSASEAGSRVPQHTAVIAAAQQVGVGRIVYTSLLRADTSELVLAPEHKATEEMLIASGIPYTILRNSWYVENYTAQIAGFVERGEIVGAAGDGRVSAATRADYAAAAVAVLTTPGHENAVYELGGPSFTLAELAQAVSEGTGADVAYRNLTVPQLVAHLEAVGLPTGTATFVAALDEGHGRGDLETSDAELVRLIGRPATSLADAIQAAKP
jgi:NAD(P)H dehydrogenase (quinone)